MQYIDKNGQRHDIPLHTVQPIVSPDEDNVLHETANGLKVSKSEAGGGDSIAVGVILPLTDVKIPNGYLECDGSAVSRTTYKELFAAIGESFGPGNGSTTFNVPNISEDSDNRIRYIIKYTPASSGGGGGGGGGGIGNVTMRTAEVTFVIAQEVKSFAQCTFTVAKRDILLALNLQPNEHILGGDDAYNFVRAITDEDFCPVSYWYDGGSSYIGFTAVNGSTKDWYVRSIRLTYYIVTED